MSDWTERAARAIERHDDGAARLPEDGDERQRQLTRMGNAAWAAGLSLLMAGREEEGRRWLLRAAERYRESWPLAPPGSWGRPIGAVKSRLIAGDRDGALDDAAWALEAGAADVGELDRSLRSGARIPRSRETMRKPLGWRRRLEGRDDFPVVVAETLVVLAAGDAAGYDRAIRALVADFEARSEFLEDTPVADTVLALQVLADERGLAVELASPLLPA